MVKNTDIGVDFQPDIHVEAKKLTELKFYCPLKVQREIQPSFDEDEEEEFFEDTEELSDFEILEYQSEISDAIEAYQCDDEENRGIMAYIGDRKRFADKVYSIFPSVEKVGERLMGVFTCQICGELDSYEYDELLHELSGQASDGWGEGFEQRAVTDFYEEEEVEYEDEDGETYCDCERIHTEVYIHFWQSEGYKIMTEEEFMA
jgi:hypothetical protein